MRTRLRAVLAVGMGWCAVSATAQASPPGDDRAAINALLDRIEEAHCQHDAQALGAGYCDDGFLLIAAPPGRPEGAFVADKTQTVAALANMWQTSQLTSHRFVGREIDVRGDVAWVTLTVAQRFAERPDRIVHAQGLAVRRADGWKMCFGTPQLARTVLLIVNVQPGSAAAMAGISVGDVVVSCDGREVRTPGEWNALFEAQKSAEPGGRTVTLVMRRGAEQSRYELPAGEWGLACEERLVPAEGAVLVEADEDHPIKALMQEELDACKARDLDRLSRLFCPAGFFSVIPQDDGLPRIVDEHTFRPFAEEALTKMAATLDLASAQNVQSRLIVKGDVALAAARLVAKQRGENGNDFSMPTVLEVYVRQNDKWAMAAMLPRRVAMGTQLWAVAQASAERTAKLEQELTGEQVGIGVGLERGEGGVRIRRVLPDSGAAHAKLEVGDIIVAVDGHTLADADAKQAVALIGGPAGSVVELTVRGEDGATRTVAVGRSRFTVPSVEWRMLPDSVALLDIRLFNEKTVEETRRALAAIADKKAVGIVLDLRGNTGGLAAEIKRVAELFIPRGKTLWYGRPVNEAASPVKSAGRRATRLPLVVLVDRATRGGELIAAAVQRNGRGEVVGQQTSGVTVSKKMVKRPDGGADFVVQYEYLLEPSEPIMGRGVTPDVEVPPEASGEAALDAAVATLRQGT